MKRLSLKSNNGNHRLSLKSKGKRLVLKRPNNPRGEEDEYPFLIFKRPDEKISRVDRYSINLYWDDFDEVGNPVQRYELMFYPSKFGMAEIESYIDGNQEVILGSDWAKRLIHRLDQLKRYGNCWWRHDTNKVMTPDNWMLGDGIICGIQEYNYEPPPPEPESTPPKRMSLKAKPKRLKLRGS